MKTASQPVVPESLQPYATDDFYETVERYAHQSLGDIVGDMPRVDLYNWYNDDSPTMGAAVYRPEEFDPKHAVFMLYPYGNGHGPSMHIRTHITQKVLGDNIQVVAIPNNTLEQQYYSLDKQQLEEVASGDASPIAAGVLGVAKVLRVESLDVVGYSQGAFVGAAVMQLAAERGDIKVNKALLAEATTFLEWTPAQLKKAFIKTGIFPLIKAVKDSGIPALTEAQAMIGVRDVHRLTAGLLRAQKGAALPENRALHEGMTYRNLATILGSIELLGSGAMGTQLTVARAEKSSVTPRSSDYDHVARYMAAQAVTIEDYGHEAADNATGVSALLTKLALQEAA